MYRFLFRPRWLAGLLIAVLLAVVCVELAQWQLRRLEQKRDINAAVTAAQLADPAPVADLLTTAAQIPAGREWRRVVATGTYDVADQVLVRGQLQDGRPGFHLVTPLLTDAGPTLLVDRGWIPINPVGGATAVPDVPAAPPGTVRVVGRIRLSQTDRADKPITTGGYLQVTGIDVGELAPRLPGPVYGAYVELTGQQPAAGPSPILVAAPVEDEGPHLAYAVQWFVFAVLGFVGYGFYARQEARVRAARQGPPAVADGRDPALIIR